MYIHFENQWRSLLNILNIPIYDCLLTNNYESEMCVVQMYKIHEKVFGRKLDLSHVRIFGSIVYVHIPDAARQKLDPKSEKCIQSSVF